MENKVTSICLLILGVSFALSLASAAPAGNQNIEVTDKTAKDEFDEAESALEPEANDMSDIESEQDSESDEVEQPKGESSNLMPWSEGSSNANDEDDSGAELKGSDSNIANAKIDMSKNDMSMAAGHHHHHGHYAHGWLKMGAHTGHKGAFGWHDKHPVGKGRR